MGVVSRSASTKGLTDGLRIYRNSRVWIQPVRVLSLETFVGLLEGVGSLAMCFAVSSDYYNVVGEGGHSQVVVDATLLAL